MGKSRRQKPAKNCEACAVSDQAILFRVKVLPRGDWRLVCKSCQAIFKQSSSAYQYGGTWKQDKRN